jgi:hypothetical protein
MLQYAAEVTVPRKVETFPTTVSMRTLSGPSVILNHKPSAALYCTVFQYVEE